MEFVFQMTDCEDPALEAEAAELLRRRLEAGSREVMPGVWKVTDRLNAHAAKGPGRETRHHRLSGVILIALGVFALVPGWMEPRTPSLIAAGGLRGGNGRLAPLPSGAEAPPAPGLLQKRGGGAPKGAPGD